MALRVGVGVGVGQDHLLNVSFPYENETVQFDKDGNPPGWYDIMNYQRLADGRRNYVQIGTWKNGTLDLPSNLDKMVNSVCSEPCPTGQVKVGHNTLFIHSFIH